ncbi:hypothetical protein [Bradyrhizobium sp. Gha]|uniref:hypothetical protein n=1 Tax=Bradyrhizobium sp. Gha TaxID=1855318 RepID=UPI000B88E462|nr:hypothetical protein [Bradyrhizobium sp. Gha]
MIALSHGSAPEIIDHGLSGFCRATVEEAVAAANAVGTLDRAAIRKQSEQRFTAERMASDYLTAYRWSLALRQRPQVDVLASLESNSEISIPTPSAGLEIAAAAAG